MVAMSSTACLKELLLGDANNDSQSDSSDGIRGILVLDGGVSTHLENLLLDESKKDGAAVHNDEDYKFPHRELWSSSLLLTEHGRSTIRRGHQDWIRAGADIVSTVTYQCHYDRSRWSDVLLNRVSFETVDEMWRSGVSLAREAVEQSSSSRRVFVAASLGCYGASLSNGAEYTGDYGRQTNDDLMYFHRRKLGQAVLNRPDAVAVETVPNLLECQALAELLAGSPPITDPEYPCACWISLACRNGNELNDGTPIETALDVLHSVPPELVQGIGFNCCDSRHLPQLVERWLNFECRKRPSQRRALLLYPNSGEAWCAENGTWIPGTGVDNSSEFCGILWRCVDSIQRHYKANAGEYQMQPMTLVLGGCCRTRPASIASLRQLVDQNSKGFK